MKKTTKGALAAFATGSLLLGGAGSLAWWTDTKNVPGATINSGHITLDAPVCGSWKIDGGTDFDPATDHLVPGDTLTQACTLDLHLVGNHIGATLAVPASTAWDTPTGLTSELAATAAFQLNSAPVTTITTEGDNEIESLVTVTYNGAAATNGSESLAAALSALTITATQTHDA